LELHLELEVKEATVKNGLASELNMTVCFIMPIINHMANPLLSGILGLLPYRTGGGNLYHATRGPSIPNEFQVFCNCGHPTNAYGICSSTYR